MGNGTSSRFPRSWLDSLPHWFNHLTHTLMGAVSGACIGTWLLAVFFDVSLERLFSGLLGSTTGASIIYLVCAIYAYLSSRFKRAAISE